MKKKRVNEGQITKDDYDADGNDPRLVQAEDPGEGMDRASNDVLQRRKIIKVPRTKFGGGGSGSTATGSSSAPNPFSSASFAQPSTSTLPLKNEVPSSKPNPFAGVSLVPNSTAPSTKSAFSFGTTPAPANPANFVFSKPSSSVAAPSQSVSSTTSKSKWSLEEQCKHLNRRFLDCVEDNATVDKFSDFTTFCDQYEDYVAEILTDANGVVPAYSENSKPFASKGAPAASAPVVTGTPTPNLWTFGSAPSPAPAKPFDSFGFGNSASAPAAPPAGTFSFTSNMTTSAPKFSFGSVHTPSSTGTPSIASSTNDNGDDPSSNPDDGLIEKIGHELNEEEDILLELKVQPMKRENDNWKKFQSGLLRLYRHKVNGDKKMVVRNSIGKVQLNLAIGKGMNFQKLVKKSPKGVAAYVQFVAVENQSSGGELFMFKTLPEKVDELHSKLKEMAA